jgi:CO/xanthine dehydrogenase FAD-binding subunit
MRSKLLRPAAACLADAAVLMEESQPGGVVLHALDASAPDNPIILALITLDARMEVAIREDEGRILHQTRPLREALESPPEAPHLPLNIRFSAPFFAAGSALRQETDLSPLQPDARAAAAFVTLNSDSGQFSFAKIALSNPGEWPRLCPIMEDLPESGSKKEAIEAMVRLAQRNCPQPRASAPPFSLALSSHLIRETLDRAMARSQAT